MDSINPSNQNSSLLIPPRRLPLLRPREVEDRNDEETVAAIRYTGQTDIPREERCQQREQPTGLDDGLVGLRWAVAMDVADSEEQEGDVHCDEDTGEDEGGFQRAEDEEECEDEPALRLLVYSVCTYIYIRRGNTIKNKPRES